jgi:hypothetical protein
MNILFPQHAELVTDERVISDMYCHGSLLAKLDGSSYIYVIYK